MNYRKVSDVRLFFNPDKEFTLIIAGVGLSWSPMPVYDATRVGAMAAVFAFGRDCYWDEDSKTFCTNPTGAIEEPGNTSLTEGGWVQSWDIRIPLEKDKHVEVNVDLTPTSTKDKTSGNPATTRLKFDVDDAKLLGVLALLKSRYCRYMSGGQLRNSDFS